MSGRSSLGTRVALFAFVVTLVGLGLAERQREREDHRDLRLTFDAQAADLEGARAQLATARLALELEDVAFRDLTAAHQELQALHRESMDWGPLRAPRDCVREVILMDDTAWPVDRDAELAHCLNAYEWCEGERTGLVEDLDQCFNMCFPHPRQRPERDDPRAGDSDSSWIDWPEGHVVKRFPSHEKKGTRDR